MTDTEAHGGTGGSRAGTDPTLGRLRALLRLQCSSAAHDAWPTFTALAAAVRDELDRPRTGGAEPGALAEVAHLQLRLEQLLRERLDELSARQRQLAAARTYLARRLG